MKTPKYAWIIAGVLVIALIIPLARLLGPAGGSGDDSGAGSSASAKSSSPRGNSGLGEGNGAGAPSKSGERPVNEVGPLEGADPEAAPPVYVRAGQELANVNGVAITLKDLMPMSAEQEIREHVLTRERYEFLLNRAVEREVTFQAAKATGVSLDSRQREALEEMRERRRNAYADKKVFDDLGDSPVNEEFQQRDSAGLMLKYSLAERSGVPSAKVDAERVRAYYEANRGEFPNLPADPAARGAAWGKVESEIRAKLAPIVRKEHAEQLAAFMESLKVKAEISIATQ